MLTWMLAAGLFALLIGVAARATEAAARVLSRQGRAPWVVALGMSLAWPALLPLLARQKITQLPPIVVQSGVVRSVAQKLPRLPTVVSSRLDVVLIAGWALASLLLAVRLIRAHGALGRISDAARAGEIDGHAVLITDGIGPAVLGITVPRVAVPAWLTELDAPLRDLVLRHEREHCRSRDTVLLWLGETAVALMPWNPAIWWQVRRLRLAVELDCDARTVGDSDVASTYGKLLLLIAQRQRMTRLAPMLAESNSHLSERISAMTRNTVGQRPLRAAALVSAAIVAIIAACSSRIGNDLTAPQPAAGKLVAAGPARQALMGNDVVYFEYQVEQPVMHDSGSVAVRYPDILKQAGVEGEVDASFVVDTTGLADVSSLKVIKSTHQLFVNAVIAALPNMRFKPALVGGKKVKQLVMEPFKFQIAAADRATYDRSAALQAKGGVLTTGGLLNAPRRP